MSNHFHIGFHKTGTTFLQAHVFPNLNGIDYLGRRYDKKDPLDANKARAIWNDDHVRAISHHRDKKALKKLEGQLTGNCLISHERLCRDWKTSLRNIKDLDDTTVIIVIRRHRDLLKSRFLHNRNMLKPALRPKYTFQGALRGEHIAIDLEIYNLDKLANTALKLFGNNVLFIRHELLFSDQNEQNRLFDFLGATRDESLFKGPKINSTKGIKGSFSSKDADFVDDYYRKSNKELDKAFNLGLKELGYY